MFYYVKKPKPGRNPNLFKDLEVTCWRYGGDGLLELCGDGSFVWDERYGRACRDRCHTTSKLKGAVWSGLGKFFLGIFILLVLF